MKCKLVLHKELSGDCSYIYSVHLEGHKNDKLTEFIRDNYLKYPGEVQEILTRLKTIGNKTGADENFFKLHEGNPGDGVCALYDKKLSNLRLYCIRYGTQIVIVGSGGYKSKKIRAHQEDPILNEENNILKLISKTITENKSIRTIQNRLMFTGDLEFEIEYEE